MNSPRILSVCSFSSFCHDLRVVVCEREHARHTTRFCAEISREEAGAPSRGCDAEGRKTAPVTAQTSQRPSPREQDASMELGITSGGSVARHLRWRERLGGHKKAPGCGVFFKRCLGLSLRESAGEKLLKNRPQTDPKPTPKRPQFVPVTTLQPCSLARRRREPRGGIPGRVALARVVFSCQRATEFYGRGVRAVLAGKCAAEARHGKAVKANECR